MYAYLVTKVFRNIPSSTIFLRKKKAEEYYKEVIQSIVDANRNRTVELTIRENETRFGKLCFIYRENIAGESKLFETIELQKQPLF